MLLVTPTAGMVTWFSDNLIVTFLLIVWVVCLIEDHYLITTLNRSVLMMDITLSTVNVPFSSQFIPYMYDSTMKVATFQWAGILGSLYILAETCM